LEKLHSGFKFNKVTKFTMLCASGIQDGHHHRILLEN